ncbi:MAG TPA: hypothetical protein VIZ18_02740 [Ktedonobacteraceae bacterium]
MSSTVAPHAHEHELEPHIRIGRARAMVIMFIISDLLSIFGIMAAGGFLRALNTENQFRIAGDHPPVLLPGLLVAIALVLSGLIYYWWARRAPVTGEIGPSAFFMLALLFMVLALVGQTWVNLSLGYTTTPFHAYESVLMLITWFTWVHFLLAIIIGILLLGRILRGRLAGFGFMAEVAGYWWYYTVLSALLLWVISLVL